MAAATLAILVVIIAALLVGELIYRRSSDTARFWGDLSQGLYAVFGLLVVIALAFGGGIWTLVAAVFIVLYYALARTRADDVRAGINGR